MDKKYHIEASDGAPRTAHTIRFFINAVSIKDAYFEAIRVVENVNPVFKARIEVTEVHE